MKRYTLEIQNESVADKVLWVLSQFKNAGVDIKEEDNNISINSSIKQAVNEINMVKSGKLKAKSVDCLLNAL